MARELKQLSTPVSGCITLLLLLRQIEIGDVFEAFPDTVEFLFVEHADEGQVLLRKLLYHTVAFASSAFLAVEIVAGVAENFYSLV